MALTFTRAALPELKRRIRSELGDDGASVVVSTLNAFALRVVLQQTAGRIPQPIRIDDDYEVLSEGWRRDLCVPSSDRIWIIVSRVPR
jgi:superfamily I DNA/RNA helicase